MTARAVHTVGHSNHPIGGFVDLLRRHGVDAVADVRSHPYSRFAPQFRREPLRAALEAAGIAYVFLGAELGARTADPACYRDGVVDYALLARQPGFRAGLDRVERGAGEHHVCLMCMERDPLACHRCILVGRRLAERGIALRHILFDGGIETGEEAEARLVRETGTTQGDVLAGDDPVARADAIRGRAIGHRRRPAARYETQILK
ncbi:MAG: DUF488 domain-containing protein [Alphaproteobacteria bacterium]|nr:DUF488 domain-containing protein [Alphaproteobacteria bacterium]